MNLRDQVRDGNRTLRVCHVLTRVSQCMAQMPGPLSKLNLGPTKVSCWILAGIFIEICVVYTCIYYKYLFTCKSANKSTWYTWCIHIFIIIWICERDIPKSYLCTTSVMIYQNESALTLFLLLSITSVMASSKKLDQNLVPDHCLSTIIGCNYTHYFSYLLHFSNHTSGNDILSVIRTIIDHSLPIYKWFPQLWTEPSIYRWILQF